MSFYSEEELDSPKLFSRLRIRGTLTRHGYKRHYKWTPDDYHELTGCAATRYAIHIARLSWRAAHELPLFTESRNDDV